MEEAMIVKPREKRIGVLLLCFIISFLEFVSYLGMLIIAYPIFPKAPFSFIAPMIPMLLFYLISSILLVLEILCRLEKLPSRVKSWYVDKWFEGWMPQERQFAVSGTFLIVFSGHLSLSMFILPLSFPTITSVIVYFGLFCLLSFVIFLLSLIHMFRQKRKKSPLFSGSLLLIMDAISELSISSEKHFKGSYRKRKITFYIITGTFIASGGVAMLLKENIIGAVLLFLVLIGSYVTAIIYSIERKERDILESELRTAHDMQMGLLPKEDPVVKGFDISGTCLPANEVGGDFFDYVWMNEKKTKLGIAVADVSGKAMKAAVTAVMTSGMIYRELEGNQIPKTILQRINKPMYAKLNRDTFTAMSFAVIDVKKKTLSFSNAGQTRPIMKRGNKSEYLMADGLPLGVLEEATYHEVKMKLKKGDMVIFYTDGINEAMNDKQEQYTLQRLEAHVAGLPSHQSAREVLESVLHSVKEFAGNAKQHDDMTVVVVKVL